MCSRTTVPSDFVSPSKLKHICPHKQQISRTLSDPSCEVRCSTAPLIGCDLLCRLALPILPLFSFPLSCPSLPPLPKCSFVLCHELPQSSRCVAVVRARFVGAFAISCQLFTHLPRIPRPFSVEPRGCCSWLSQFRAAFGTGCFIASTSVCFLAFGSDRILADDVPLALKVMHILASAIFDVCCPEIAITGGQGEHPVPKLCGVETTSVCSVLRFFQMFSSHLKRNIARACIEALVFSFCSSSEALAPHHIDGL